VKVLFFNIEHYLGFEEESQNFLARLPIIHCGLDIEYRDHIHQRDLASLGRDAAEANALRAVKDFRPDVVVYFQAWRDDDLSPAFFAAVRGMNIPIVAFIWDSNLYPRLNELRLFEAADCLVIVDSLDAYLRWRLMARMCGGDKLVAFGAGMYYAPSQSTNSLAKIHDVTLVGSVEGERGDLLKTLNELLAAQGVTLSHLGGTVTSTPGERVSKAWLSWQDYDAAIRQSKICISSQSAINRRHIKGKIFEVMARGTMCMIDDSSENRRLFPSDVVGWYENPTHCAAQIRAFLDAPVKRSQIEAAASAWLAKSCDWKRFYSALLERVVHGRGDVPVPATLDSNFVQAWERRYLMMPVLSDLVTSMIKYIDQSEGFGRAN